VRVPISWLRDYVPLEMPLPDLADRLSVATAEIEGIEARGVADADGNLGLFRVGKVLEAIKHPNADRLQLTQVDLGEGEPRQIVCGAWNFGAGATVAVALPGAVLPNGLQLEQRKVRGELSDGMILAEDEVDLGSDHAGIMLLPETEPGTPLADVLPLRDEVLLVESTGNRPDLLSVYGLAREIAALYDLPLAAMPGCLTPAPAPADTVDVRIEDFTGCPRYIGRLFRDVAIGPSPVWLKARLLAAGVRSISNVVDVTNYVMLALGSPLHAFDYETLRGGRIVVRRAADGEKLRTLDGVERALDPRDLVIADAERAVALAGIMGGEETEIGEQTTNVLLEAANFEPFGLFQTSERQRLRTEGLNRWEKGVDPHVAEAAANHATELLLELAGGSWAGDSDVHEALPERPVVRFRPTRADEVIGIETPPAEQFRILTRLGFEQSGDDVAVPTWRARDVTREIDVVEEIARFRLDDVPFTLPQRRAMFGALTRFQLLRRRVEDVLAGLGLAETYTPSLRADDPSPDALRLPEPLSAELAVLRTRLLPSLVDAARRNFEIGASGVALFEIARVYGPEGDGLPDERLHVAGIVEGGFARAKGVVDALHAALKIDPTYERAADELLHPAKAAAVPAGLVGELHPALLAGAWGVFELELSLLFADARDDAKFVDVVSFPPVREDLAFVVADDTPAGELAAAAHEAAGSELREFRPFDVYRGPQVGEGRKSIAFAATFQSPERTLTDEDAARLRAAIVDALARRFGAELRA
jgi:phenylalanyl-tRNA synthetase beta chain